MTESERIEAEIAAKNRELERIKAELSLVQVKSWRDFIRLPWPEQQHLEALAPDTVAKLKRDFFSPFQSGR